MIVEPSSASALSPASAPSPPSVPKSANDTENYPQGPSASKTMEHPPPYSSSPGPHILPARYAAATLPERHAVLRPPDVHQHNHDEQYVPFRFLRNVISPPTQRALVRFYGSLLIALGIMFLWAMLMQSFRYMAWASVPHQPSPHDHLPHGRHIIAARLVNVD